MTRRAKFELWIVAIASACMLLGYFTQTLIVSEDCEAKGRISIDGKKFECKQVI